MWFFLNCRLCSFFLSLIVDSLRSPNFLQGCILLVVIKPIDYFQLLKQLKIINWHEGFSFLFFSFFLVVFHLSVTSFLSHFFFCKEKLSYLLVWSWTRFARLTFYRGVYWFVSCYDYKYVLMDGSTE